MKVGRVQIERRIGRGGMADVYLGRHQSLDRPVAVKLLHAHLVDEEQGARRFLAEARAVAQLHHPNIVQIYDFQLLDGRPSIVMELVLGPSLSSYLRSIAEDGHRIPSNTTGALVLQVAKALDHAHTHGIVHRDVKPANILLRAPSGPVALGQPLPAEVEAVLSDFGVARIAATSMRTTTGTILGTPAYMAPEQVTGGEISPRTDIYSLAAVSYELLTGHVPYPTDDVTPAAAFFQHVHAPIPAMADLPESVASVLRRGLAKDPADRHMTAGEFGRDLARALSDRRSAVTMKGKRPAAVERAVKRRGPRPRLLALAIVPLAIGLAGLAWLGRDRLIGMVSDGLPSATPGQRAQVEPTNVAFAPARATPTATAEDGSVGTAEATNAGALQTARPAATRPQGDPTQAPRPSKTPLATATRLPSETAGPSATPTPVPTKPPTKEPTKPVPIISLPTVELVP